MLIHRTTDVTTTEAKFQIMSSARTCPQPDLTFGIQTHTDTAMLTVLLPSHVPGLQVKNGKDWINVSPLPGALIINVGDLLRILSNGKYQSVRHRVLANSSPELRISVNMFFNFRWKDGDEDLYGPIPELLSQDDPPIYRNFTKQEFLEDAFNKAFSTKSFLQKIKIEN